MWGIGQRCLLKISFKDHQDSFLSRDFGRAHACMNICQLLLPSFVPWTFFHFPESIANRKHSKYVERCSASYVCKDLFLFRFCSTISDCILAVMQIPYVRANPQYDPFAFDSISLFSFVHFRVYHALLRASACAHF